MNATLSWNIEELKGNFFKESDPFWFENAQWRLSVSHFQQEQDLKILIKMHTNPFETKESKSYFKKKEFFLPSNMIQN